jgi:elongation factor P--(R)-beta-lysine ligase
MSPAPSKPSWRPSASLEVLQQRARLLADIRQFFAERQVMEVETPLLCRHTVTDRYIDSFSVPTDDGDRYLQTSPEYCMKRLLAAGAGAMYQICKAFRKEQPSAHHNPEFTMLEWYRPGWSDAQLRDEIDALMQTVVGAPSALTTTYQQAFISALGIDPLAITEEELQLFMEQKAPNEFSAAWKEAGKDALLQVCFNRWVESHLDANRPTFVTDFPATQAALAEINPGDTRTAKRFELYYRGLELANGFQELTDPVEQEERFIRDQHDRKAHNRFVPAIDDAFIQALRSGIPRCAGVALGVDRLLMCLTGSTLAKSVSFFSAIA